jgi:hypothetical protein
MTKKSIDEDIEKLFSLPLMEFTDTRNRLAATLKKGGHADEAARVKALAKPPVSAWAVNQLYWKHREAFDRLLTAGQRLRQAQALQLAGKSPDMAGPRDGRAAAISGLLRLAAELLEHSGHSATPETMRRITTTLEAISAYALLPDASTPGRLTADIDPPGFEALAELMPAKEPAPRIDLRESKKSRQAETIAAQALLRDAERALKAARGKVNAAEAALKKARAASNEAKKVEHQMEREAREAATELENAERAVAEASAALEKRG